MLEMIGLEDGSLSEVFSFPSPEFRGRARRYSMKSTSSVRLTNHNYTQGLVKCPY